MKKNGGGRAELQGPGGSGGQWGPVGGQGCQDNYLQIPCYDFI